MNAVKLAAAERKCFGARSGKTWWRFWIGQRWRRHVENWGIGGAIADAIPARRCIHSFCRLIVLQRHMRFRGARNAVAGTKNAVGGRPNDPRMTKWRYSISPGWRWISITPGALLDLGSRCLCCRIPSIAGRSARTEVRRSPVLIDWRVRGLRADESVRGDVPV